MAPSKEHIFRHLEHGRVLYVREREHIAKKMFHAPSLHPVGDNGLPEYRPDETAELGEQNRENRFDQIFAFRIRMGGSLFGNNQRNRAGVRVIPAFSQQPADDLFEVVRIHLRSMPLGPLSNV